MVSRKMLKCLQSLGRPPIQPGSIWAVAVAIFALAGQVGPTDAASDPARQPSAGPRPPPASIPASNGPALPTDRVRQLGPSLFQVGAVRIDREQRTLRFPALVNLREGNLEYLLVTSFGKTHESLLRTEVRPFQLQVALLLLGA